MTIKERARELVELCGAGLQARERIILALMEEFGVTPASAIQYLSQAKREMNHDKNRVCRPEH